MGVYGTGGESLLAKFGSRDDARDWKGGVGAEMRLPMGTGDEQRRANKGGIDAWARKEQQVSCGAGNADAQFHPGYFGKLGMRHYHLLRNQYYRPTINIDKVSFRIQHYDYRLQSRSARVPRRRSR